MSVSSFSELQWLLATSGDSPPRLSVIAMGHRRPFNIMLIIEGEDAGKFILWAAAHDENNEPVLDGIGENVIEDLGRFVTVFYAMAEAESINLGESAL